MCPIKLETTVYVTEGLEISEISYREYLDNYASTVEYEFSISETDYSSDECDKSEAFSVFNVRPNRSPKFLMGFESKEDAESFIYDKVKEHLNTHCYNFPSCEESREMAIFWIAERESRSVEVIERYLQILDGIKKRNAAQKAIWEKEYAAKKALSDANTTDDINHLKPLVDEQFKSDLAESAKLQGQAKSDAQGRALSELLIRVNYFITGDFWKVFRAIK
jgi:hypothetical protein